MEKEILNTRFKKSNNVIFRKIADEFVLVPIHKDAVDLESLFSFNQTAARIWELIDENKTGLDIVEVISSEFNQGKDKVTDDLVEFMVKLREFNFITKAN